jgi:hypothetical protein
MPFAKVPLAPFDGAVNVTLTLDTKFPDASFTIACNAVANAVVIVADCPPPVVAVTEAGAPGLLVRLKLALALTPPTDAVTL